MPLTSLNCARTPISDLSPLRGMPLTVPPRAGVMANTAETPTVEAKETHVMPKIEQVLKSEIIRLAKKHVRAVCGLLARDVQELKRRMSQMSKTVAALDKMRAALEAKRAAEGVKLEAPEEKVKAARLSPLLIKKLRARLGVRQGQLARLVGVTGPAVAFWEQGKSRPQGQNRAALVALRGVGRREVKRMLAEKAKAESPQKKTEPRARQEGGENV